MSPRHVQLACVWARARAYGCEVAACPTSMRAHVVPELKDLLEDAIGVGRRLGLRVCEEGRVLDRARGALRCEADAEEGVRIEREEDLPPHV